MPDAEQFPFVESDPSLGEASRLPFLPITLSLQGRSTTVSALVDTGSTVNVLPYDVGLRLGAVWDQVPTTVNLTGNLAREPARVLVVQATVATFRPLRLAFAWSRLSSVPVILGQVNFLLEFDVCFFRSRSLFELRPT